jgi:hypothetical protein
MKTSTRIALLAATGAGWAGTVGLVRLLLAPATGAAIVGQMAPSNAAYFASLGVASGSSIATGIVTAIFGVVAIVILRAR